ncbi:hypothetical protein AB0D08_32980 [Kitasatospora sp. NPDC048540]|uniref:hypothetical protein n=1 Tax=Kitasatospora sp. NPDC048540 TaxID=3155634 RepID=UPI0034053584
MTVISTAETVLIAIRPAREAPVRPFAGGTGAGASSGGSDGGCAGGVLMTLQDDGGGRTAAAFHWYVL